VTKKIHEEDR